jgi:hypothetical protein
VALPVWIPAAINAAKVRLHVGSDAPTTAFIGRPVLESGTFHLDLLKSVHMTASACTAMFMNGIAESKIAIERMTVTEAVKFMKSVAGNVIRNRGRQYLSAAFKINTPFIDDCPEVLAFTNGVPAKITDRMDVARMGITIARLAGFDKVTWEPMRRSSRKRETTWNPLSKACQAFKRRYPSPSQANMDRGLRSNCSFCTRKANKRTFCHGRDKSSFTF